MKKFAKIAALLMAVILFATTGESLTAMAATEPTISKTSRIIFVGGSSVFPETSTYSKSTYTLTIKNRPDKYSVKWTSSDEAVATVAPKNGTSKYKGTVTAVAPGKATITATITTPYATYKKTCKVTIRKNCAAVDITPATVGEIKVGETVALKGTMYDKAAREAVYGKDTTDIVKWKTSDASVATVSSNGVVTAVAPGKATITCYTVQTSSGTRAKFEYATAKDTVDITVKEAGVTAMVSAKQINLRSFEVTFATDAFKTLTKDNFKVTRSNTVAEIEDVKFDESGKVATVTLKSNIIQTLVHSVEVTGTNAVKGTKVEFTASNLKPAGMKITTDMPGNRVIAGETASIHYKFYDANGVDITPAKETDNDYIKLVSYVTIKATDNTSLSAVYGDTVWIYEPNQVVNAVATYNDYSGNTFTAVASFASVSEASTITSVIATVTNSSKSAAALDWTKPVTSLSVSDITGYRIVVRAQKADGKYVYSDDPGTKISVGFSPNYTSKNMFLSPDGTIFPLAEGSDQVVIYYGETPVSAIPVSIGPARIPVRMAVMIDGVEGTSVEMSDAYGVTNPEIKVALYDNYGALYPMGSTFGLSAASSDTKSSMYFSIPGVNSDGTATIEPLVWAQGTEAGAVHTVLVKLQTGTVTLNTAFKMTVYKPNELLPTSYRAIVQGDTDAVVNAGFDTANGKNVTVKLVAYKGKVRYSEVVLNEKDYASTDSYYALVKFGNTDISNKCDFSSGSLVIPVAKVSGSTIEKLTTGTYGVFIYRKGLGTSDPIVATTSVNITDSQEGAKVEKLKSTTYTTLTSSTPKDVLMSVFNECFKVTVGGKTATVIDIDAFPAAGGMYVKTVKVVAPTTVNSAEYNVTYNVEVSNAVQVQK